MSEIDMQKMLQHAQQMQSRIGDLQQELATRHFEGSSGGGMVLVTITGALRVLSVKIEASLIAGEDRAMLQDLVAAAVNAALSKAQESVSRELARVQQSMLTGLGN